MVVCFPVPRGDLVHAVEAAVFWALNEGFETVIMNDGLFLVHCIFDFIGYVVKTL